MSLFSNSKVNKLTEFFCGMGESEFLETSINITDYPFEPSSIFPNKEIQASQINVVHLDKYPPTIKIGDELIFISREHVDELKAFAERNKLKTAKRNSNWDWITEPFLDTEFSNKDQMRTSEILTKNGISEKEIAELRIEIGDYMIEYNFSTMLWEWANLGLLDVLSAMRVKLNKEEFKKFYWRAMEIEQRNKDV